MSFKDALNKAKGKGKVPFPPFSADEDGEDMPEEKPKGKKGGFMQAAKNAKKKSKNKSKK